MDGVSRIITVRSLGAQNQSIDFVETCFTDQKDLIPVLYSVTNNGLTSIN
jgi:hypothetical protein